jgi:hypothetical protein
MGELTYIMTYTASFDINDLLTTPVPYSVYTSQPYCASAIYSNGCNASLCPTTRPYNPLIVGDSHTSVQTNMLTKFRSYQVQCSTHSILPGPAVPLI